MMAGVAAPDAVKASIAAYRARPTDVIITPFGKRAITLEHASLPFMQKFSDRFDDATMRRESEAELLPVGSDSTKVRVGKVGVHHLSDETVAATDKLWLEIVEPVTGFDSYQALIDSRAQRSLVTS